MKTLDLRGIRFGYLTAVEPSNERSGHCIKWVCKCDCGRVSLVSARSLVTGRTKSCGCKKGQMCRDANVTHDMSGSPLYDVYNQMVARCSSPRNHAYQNYGGRGIKVCDEWLNDRATFFSWAKANGYSPGLSIDRIDNNGDYSPENCRLVTRSIQNNNKRSNHPVVLNGELMSLADACRKIGAKYSTIRSRLRSGWTVERALNYGK